MSDLTADTDAHLGLHRKMPPGRSMVGGATELARGRLADVLLEAALVSDEDRHRLYLHVDGRDRALLWAEIAPLLRRPELLAE